MVQKIPSKKPTREVAYALIVFFLVLFPLGVVLALSWVHLLPEKFFYDGNYIRSLLDSSSPWNLDSFARTAWVYSLLGYSAETSQEVVAVTVFCLAFLAVLSGFILGVRSPSYAGLVLLAIWVGVSTVYLGQYSKELIAMWAVLGALYLLGLKRPLAWAAFLVVLVYGIFFRSYWVLTASFWLLLFWLSYRPWAGHLKAIFLFCAIALVSIAFYEAFGYHITEARDRVNEYRLGSPDAVTMLSNYLPSDTVLSVPINWLLSWFLILIPLPLLLLFKPVYLAAFLIAVTTLRLLAQSYLRLGSQKKYLPRAQERRLRGSLTFMLAFTLIQGVFEPDYGSVLKHWMDLLPMLAYVLAFGAWRARGETKNFANT